MSKETSKNRKILKIVLTAVISLVLLVTLICGGITLYEATPHKRHFNKVILVSSKKQDGRYLYHASNNAGKVFILKTAADLRENFESSADDPYDLGEQDLTVKATGIGIYRTDISGMNLSYPTIVYEYVSG